ncbi:MAG: hypothetical protein QOJ29_4631 [Thermoleophilaceae bacterium]|nr:hypothetical protein [Thermoleophilaceae bacterium]
MRRIAAITALAAALIAPNASAAGLDQTCELTATRFDADTINVLFPDSSAQYWTGSYRALPGTHIRIDGIYPYARYTSWNVYDPILRPFTHKADVDIAPDAGSANPFLPGANRRTPVEQRHYTLFITFDPDFKPGPNTIYVDPSKNPVCFFTLRVYVPDRGLDVTGGVGIPQVTWQPNSEGAPAVTSPCRDTQKPSISAITQAYAQQDGPDTGPPVPGQPQPKWHKFTNLCQAGDDLFFDNPYGDSLPDSGQSPCSNFGSGGFLSNMDNAYVYTGFNRSYGKLLVLHGKAPTFARTYPRAHTMPSGVQLRYWSICQNDPYNQRYVACLRDDQVKLDKDGFYTIVVSRPVDRPACAKNWIPWGPQPWGTLIYRHMLPDPGFSGAIQRASYGTEQSSMGDYYPSARYSTAPASFCAKK